MKDEEGGPEPARVLNSFVDPDAVTLSKESWREGITTLKENELVDIRDLQSIWWLYPLYREDPEELDRLLRKIYED
ncbi:hypothetical protein AKJ51_00055 [candidate division MSBL1 archaeon SCGC-AAA382A20]|uniref:Uncharacterized protein n=1 Tax=candidate division MSBL1 archaeon SCGC-AAA382A20 TaxID=1698280 RepID=A0A133VMU2_9EURY|nr:hypothetical protein AKJ51_00055 [candidate division MSBL1 archaeon SCGC-AAA382A20]